MRISRERHFPAGRAACVWGPRTVHVRKRFALYCRRICVSGVQDPSRPCECNEYCIVSFIVFQPRGFGTLSWSLRDPADCKRFALPAGAFEQAPRTIAAFTSAGRASPRRARCSFTLSTGPGPTEHWRSANPMLCYAMLSYALRCDAMRCDAMLCYPSSIATSPGAPGRWQSN